LSTDDITDSNNNTYLCLILYNNKKYFTKYVRLTLREKSVDILLTNRNDKKNIFLNEPTVCVYNLTRKSNVSFVGKVNYFGGSLIMLKPKKQCNLNNIVTYLNGDIFKDNFMFSGRFKIGHRQICNSYIPNSVLEC